MSTTDFALKIQNLTFAYKPGDPVLKIEQLALKPGSRTFLRGASGGGKSTLMSLIAGVIAPQSGEISVLGTSLGALSNAGRDKLRAEKMGVIFQMFNLLPFLSVGENVLLPCRFSKQRSLQAIREHGAADLAARALLDRLGLPSDRYFNRQTSDLSVGQQQRVAAARALIGGPQMILADEPTSALDTDNRQAFIELLLDETAQSGATLIFVSHDRDLARFFDNQVDLDALNTAPRTRKDA